MEIGLPLILKVSVCLYQKVKCLVLTPRSDRGIANTNIQQGKKHLQNAKQQSSSSTPFPEVSVQQVCFFTEKKKGVRRTEEACMSSSTYTINQNPPYKKPKKSLQNTRDMRPSSGTLQIILPLPFPFYKR